MRTYGVHPQVKPETSQFPCEELPHMPGWDNGLQGIRLDPIFGVFEFNIFGITAYFYALVVLFGWFELAWRIVHSPFGRSLDGIR